MRRTIASLATATTILVAPTTTAHPTEPDNTKPDQPATAATPQLTRTNPDTTLDEQLVEQYPGGPLVPPAVARYLDALHAAELAVREFLDWHLVERFRAVLDCIAGRESGGSYTVVNTSGSSASGRYQWLDGSWQSYSAGAGRSGWARAMHAPPAVQDFVTAWALDTGGLDPWRASGSHRACAGLMP